MASDMQSIKRRMKSVESTKKDNKSYAVSRNI